MGNEIYKEKNLKSHPKEVLDRILEDLEAFEPHVREGTKTDLCCGNCDVGMHTNADYFYDLYPAYYFVDQLDLEAPIMPTVHKADNVFMFHALEHFENPLHVLMRINDSLLEKHGRLFLAVPDAFYTDEENGYRPYDESIGHKFQFGNMLLQALLVQAGYNVLFLDCVKHEPNFHEILAVGEKI